MRDNIKLKMKIDAVAADARGDAATREVARTKSAKITPVLQPIFVEVARPRLSSGFPNGKIEQAQWAEVEPGIVQLFSLDGKSLGHKFRRAVRAPLSARQVAALLLRQKVDWKSSSFNRPLVYPRGFGN